MTTISVKKPAKCPLATNPGLRPTFVPTPPLQRRPFVLLDRDGTLIVHRPYLCDPAGVELLPGVVEGLRLLQSRNFGLGIITNQSGIGRRYFSYQQYYAVHDRLLEMLLHEGITIDGVYFCPHAPDEQCGCRKPKPRLVHRAAAELNFDPTQAFIIGDSECDMKLALNAGARSILIAGQNAHLPADYVAGSIEQAAHWILRAATRSKAA